MFSWTVLALQFIILTLPSTQIVNAQSEQNGSCPALTEQCQATLMSRLWGLYRNNLTVAQSSDDALSTLYDGLNQALSACDNSRSQIRVGEEMYINVCIHKKTRVCANSAQDLVVCVDAAPSPAEIHTVQHSWPDMDDTSCTSHAAVSHAGKLDAYHGKMPINVIQAVSMKLHDELKPK